MSETPRKRNVRKQPTFLRPAERDELLALVSDVRDRAIVTTFLYGGLRLNELTHLDRKDVDFKEQTIHVRFGKGGKERTVRLHREAAAAIAAYLATRVDPLQPLFLSSRRRRIANNTVQHMLRGYVARCSFAEKKHVTPHCLRHSFATALMKASSKDLPVVQRALGHSNIATTAIYLHLDDDEMYAAMDKL